VRKINAQLITKWGLCQLAGIHTTAQESRMNPKEYFGIHRNPYPSWETQSANNNAESNTNMLMDLERPDPESFRKALARYQAA
jgi:hypothetical protein